MPTVNERVEAGIELLDRELGKAWPHAIDTVRLNLRDFNSCVLGQLHGTYTDGVDALWGDEADYVDPSAFGFYRRREYWTSLTDAWLTRLKELRQTRRFRPSRRLAALMEGERHQPR